MLAKLTPEAVEDLMRECLSPGDGKQVTGISRTFTFDETKIAENADLISELLHELPEEFMMSGGGGWSFLNACNDKHGRQWTGFHAVMEALFCLGIAASKAKWLLPRDMWSVLPGGMPYVGVLTT